MKKQVTLVAENDDATEDEDQEEAKSLPAVENKKAEPAPVVVTTAKPEEI